MKRLQEETGVKMSILGKGSMRDKGKVREILICAEILLFNLSKKEIFTQTKALEIPPEHRGIF